MWSRVRPRVEWRAQWLGDPDYRASYRQRSWRRASFPFVSGDTFRIAAQHIVDAPGDLSEAAAALLASRGEQVVFTSTDAAAAVLTGLPDTITARVRLLIHNGDTPPLDVIREQAHRFLRVHSVNWMGSREIALPLPIGLENVAYCMNGRYELFRDALPARRQALEAGRARTHGVLLAFSDHTNPAARTPARQAFLTSGLDVSAPTWLSQRQYQRMLRSHHFVVSPPGNGLDCHRTWEAMYVGTIPIVLAEAWPFRDHDWPVLVVDEWSDAITALAGDLAGLRQQILSRADSDFYAMDFLQALR